jgi:membrane dipeptidase
MRKAAHGATWCAVILGCVLWGGPVGLADDAAPIVVSDVARALHNSAIVIDGHNDLPWELRRKGGGKFDKVDVRQSLPEFHTDIPRLRAGGVGAQFWAAYAPVETIKEHRAGIYTLEQIDLIHRMVAHAPESFELARTADDIERIRAAGKIACLIGVEGGHSIENSLGLLRIYHTLGVRYMTLTHSDTLDWADAATDAERHDGLTAFGEDVVRTMNELGMLVDISHVSPATMRDAIRVSRAPVIASHSSAYAVAAHPRNVPDDVLQLIKQNDGVVMVNFFSGFVVPSSAQRMTQMFAVRRELQAKFPKEEEFQAALSDWRKKNPIERGTIHDVVRHIDHIAKLIGAEHVGLGSDYDGITSLPEQLEDVSTYPRITQVLLDRGYTAEEIRGILGQNVLRVMRKAEAVSQQRPAESATKPQ